MMDMASIEHRFSFFPRFSEKVTPFLDLYGIDDFEHINTKLIEIMNELSIQMFEDG